MSADLQVLDALAALLTPAATGAQTVDVERDDSAQPYTPEELPAINILAVDEDIENTALVHPAAPVLQMRSLALVVQIVYRGQGSARSARAVGSAVEALIAQDASLGGLCVAAVRPNGRQWLRDDAAEQPLTRQNTRFLAEYRTYSHQPQRVIALTT